MIVCITVVIGEYEIYNIVCHTSSSIQVVFWPELKGFKIVLSFKDSFAANNIICVPEYVAEFVLLIMRGQSMTKNIYS